MHSAQLRVSAAADGSATIIPTSKKLPVSRKIIRHHEKKRQFITFLSSIYQGEDPGQKFYLPGTSLFREATGGVRVIKNPDDTLQQL